MNDTLDIAISCEKGKLWNHYEVSAMLGDKCIGSAAGYEKERNKFHLTYLKVDSEHTRTGVGTRIMEALCELADVKGWTMDLTPSPQEPRKMSLRDLRRFYASFGFRRWVYGDMIRCPEPREDF